MRKLIFILIILIANINSFSQDVVGDRIIAKQALYVRGVWIDSIRVDTVNIQNDNRTLMTAGAIYKFVSNRIGGGGGSGTVTSVTGTADRITITGTPTVNPTVNIAATYAGQTSITTLGTITTGVWNGTAIANANLANSTISGISLGSNLNDLTVGYGVLFNSGTTYNGGTAKTITFDSATVLPQVRSNIDTTFIKVATYTADQKRGNVLGTLYEQVGFADLDTFALSGVTPTISNSMILLGDGTSSFGQATLKRYTMLNRWALKAGFKVGEKDGDSYSFNIGVESANTTYVQDIFGVFHHRSSPSQYNGFLTLQDDDGVIATSATAVSHSATDSIEVTLQRNVNIFTFTARNITTDGDPVSVSYTYTGYTTAVNTGRPIISATGSDSVYYFHFYSNESTGADLITIGDSKFTWYGISINEAIPSQMYALDGNVINHSGSGDKTLEVTLTTDEIISLTPRQALIDIGSNDIRLGVASGTWQANIDTIYNRLTAAGITVYFALAYETAISQTALVTYLESTYPTRYIPNGYDTTFNCTSCLQSDGIHLTSYGDSIWVAGIEQSGMVNFSTVGAATDLTVGSTTVTSGTTTRVLYNNAGVLGEYTISGTGNVAMTTSPVFTTPNLGVPSALTLTNATGLPPVAGIVGWPANSAGVLTNDGAGVLSWGAGGATTWNGIADPTGDLALSFGAGESTTFTDANTTEDFLTINNATSTTSTIFSINRTSTALTSGNYLAEFISSGANANSLQTASGLNISVTNTNATGGTNVGLTVTASGATTANYAALFTGRVGIGQTAPQTLLHVGPGGTATGFGSGAQLTVSNSGSASYLNVFGPSSTEVFIGAESALGIFGTLSNHPLLFRTNNTLRGQFTTAGTLLMSYGVVEKQGADVASVAGAVTLGVDGNAFEITGTNAITLIANTNFQNGHIVTLLFTSTATLTDGTANSGANIGMELAGNTNFVASAGATVTLRLMELGGTQRWYEVARSVQ
jgi:hypothetical protein